MAICAFLGNATVWNEQAVEEKLRQVLVDLIEKQGVTTFLVGTHGAFEVLSHHVVSDLAPTYPQIEIMLVLAYAEDLHRCRYAFDGIQYPPAAETSYKRWCIAKRNDWIVRQTDYIITLNYYKGRADTYCRRARKQGKSIIDLVDLLPVSSDT